MKEEDYKERLQGLHALMSRGKMPNTEQAKLAVAEIMKPLPAPGEWQHIREQAELTASDMEAHTGFSCSRIRYWEKGKGTSRPEQWLQYAELLLEVAGRTLRSQNELSIEQAAQRNGQVSEAIASQMQNLRSTRVAVSVWADHGVQCTSYEAQQLSTSIRETIRELQRVYRQVGKVRKEQET